MLPSQVLLSAAHIIGIFAMVTRGIHIMTIGLLDSPVGHIGVMLTTHGFIIVGGTALAGIIPGDGMILGGVQTTGDGEDPFTGVGIARIMADGADATTVMVGADMEVLHPALITWQVVADR